MRRRQFLAVGATATTVGTAGCFGDDGYPTETFEGTDVPLAPLEDVYEWYEDDDARFVDTRTQIEYDDLHIAGAVYSPAEHGLEADDPTEEWSTDARIVTYCICPHTLAGLRAASLIDDGYEDVYALDEGLQAWYEEGYPMEGEEVQGRLPAYDVRGEADPAHAGEFVWVREPETGQREPGTIEEDGSYELTLHFSELTEETVLELEAPDYTRELTLAELTDGVVTAE
ncbi:rhodanese-like domain-containing protein [Natronococcus sp.]|uniref:rhodanese-like domain-containing protein n=1 Tax=Natronococcus sp. TaxID=35747 RepID=UPI003A4D4B9B